MLHLTIFTYTIQEYQRPLLEYKYNGGKKLINKFKFKGQIAFHVCTDYLLFSKLNSCKIIFHFLTFANLPFKSRTLIPNVEG